MSFFQDPPALGNQYDDDVLLRELLARRLPEDARRAIEPSLVEMGGLAAGRLFELSQNARGQEPVLVPCDAWGRRVDEIRVPPAWKEYARVAAEFGLVGIPYERAQGPWSRLHQFALVYLFAPSSSIYTCPLAMSDGAAKTLLHHGAARLAERALPRLTSRDPHLAWTSGQWMTERTGGSDVGQTETVARHSTHGWRLHGTKWFTSATTSEMALTLARPEGNPPGGRGLALFYLELRSPEGGWNGIHVLRLKDKLGTRMLPTAELELDGARAEPVAGTAEGVKAITPMLHITRLWNAVCAVASMRRGMALARDYARRREAFGSPLAEKPLHVETLAHLEAELESATLLFFRAVELLGREEAEAASDEERLVARALQPVVKLLTARQAVAHASEVLEAFGGAGYVEDTGLPALLRDAQVLTIWEGTTNVLALDLLRALGDGQALEALLRDLEVRAGRATHPALQGPRVRAVEAARRAAAWLRARAGEDLELLEAGARAFALTLGRAYSLALVLEHAQWLLDARGNRRGVAVARRLAASGLDVLDTVDAPGEARQVAFPEPR
ncbi:MAG TPA: acyl-CoA dehydrogenase family protein [Myxococcaceae bacterium]|nr:acyl-CoA dehydrogenase family protein [Myxococcaceae bacterium]